MMSTAIARVTGIIILTYTNRITAIRQRYQHGSEHTKMEHVTEFSLVDDSGDHVLNFGATVHGRRLDSTKTLRLNFQAFGASHSYHLHRSPSVLSKTTKVYRYDQANKGYDVYDAAGHEARLFSSEGVALTFLAHDKIKGRVLLHNRTLGFENKKTDKLVVRSSPYAVNCGVDASKSGIQGQHHDHHKIEASSVHDASKNLRVSGAHAQHSTVSNHRRLELTKWFGSNDCYYRDDVTRRFAVGIGVGSTMWDYEFESDADAVKFVQSIFHEANLVYRDQLNLFLTVGAVVLGTSNTMLDGTSIEHREDIAPPKWDNKDCVMDINQQLDALSDWIPPEQFGAWHVIEDCYYEHGTSIQGLANIGTLCRIDGANTGVNYYDAFGDSTWLVFAHELGHNFGASHSFEEGKGRTGGVMDYGDGKLAGTYQFNTKYRKEQMCKEIAANVQQCPQGFDTMKPVCGNGILDDGETCECSNGETSCKYCDGCQLAQGKMCTPEGHNAQCCLSNGQLADTSVLCKKAGKTGTCGSINGECLLSPFALYGLGEICGIHDKSNPCKLKFQQSQASCDYKSYTRCGNGKGEIGTVWCNSVQEGALCVANGQLRTCKWRSGPTEMACTGDLPAIFRSRTAGGGQSGAQASPVVEPNVDCVGSWQPWTSCGIEGTTFKCPTQYGMQSRTYKQSIAQSGNGAACEEENGKIQSRYCRYNKCPVDCQAEWVNTQNGCSATCGNNAVRTQVLEVVVPALNGGRSCQQIYGFDTVRQTPCTGLPACRAVPRVDCQGEYGVFSSCVPNVGDCGAGKRARSFRVTIKASGGGRSCGYTPPLEQSCQVPCVHDCVGEWMDKPCSKLCGPDSVKTRRYLVLHPSENGGKACPVEDGIEKTESCKNIPCPVPTRQGQCDAPLIDRTYLFARTQSIKVKDSKACYEKCMATQECNSFSYTPGYGTCQLWTAQQTSSVSVASIPSRTGTNLHRNCKKDVFVPSDTCGDKWAGQSIEGRALGVYSNRDLKTCNSYCDSYTPCAAWSFSSNSKTCKMFTKAAAEDTSTWKRDPETDVYRCATRFPQDPVVVVRGPPPSTSCECDTIGMFTGLAGCKRHNQNKIHWCYVSMGCDMDKWLAENGPNFQHGESKTFGMKWRQCQPGQDIPEDPISDLCEMIEARGLQTRGNGVCDSQLNIEKCQWDGGDCCDKNDVPPDFSFCLADSCSCACLDPTNGGQGSNEKCGCRNSQACNFDELASTGSDEEFCTFPQEGFDCAGSCIDERVCGGGYEEQKGCCRTDRRQAFDRTRYKLVRADRLTDCQAACNADSECTGFQWRQGLQECRTFHTDVPAYGETACTGGDSIQCFINLNPPKPKCFDGPFNNTVNKLGLDCSHYAAKPTLCDHAKHLDTDTFKSMDCCACQDFQCHDHNHESKRDTMNMGCADYAKDPERYCSEGQNEVRKTNRFSSIMCCVCAPKNLAALNLPPETTDPSASSGLDARAITGIVVGIILPVLIVGIAVAVYILLVRAKSKGNGGQDPIGTFKSKFIDSGYSSPKGLDSPSSHSTREIDEVAEFEEMKRDTKRASDAIKAPKTHGSNVSADVPDSTNSAAVDSPGSPADNASDTPVDDTLTETVTENVDAAAGEADDDEGPPPALPVRNHGHSRTSEASGAAVDDSVSGAVADTVEDDDDEGPPPSVPVKNH